MRFQVEAARPAGISQITLLPRVLMTLLALAFLLSGIGLFAYHVAIVRTWRPIEATVVRSEVIGFRNKKQQSMYRGEVELAYTVSGREYRTPEAFSTATSSGDSLREKMETVYGVGTKHVVFYDPTNPYTLRWNDETARRLESEGDFGEAIRWWQKSRNLCHSARQDIREHADTRLQLSQTLSGLAATQILAGQLEDAVASYSERAEVLKSLVDVTPFAGRDLCHAFYWRGKMQSELGRQEELVYCSQSDSRSASLLRHAVIGSSNAVRWLLGFLLNYLARSLATPSPTRRLGPWPLEGEPGS